MELKEYFASVKGTGILSTADDKGVVNAAVYASPHCLEDGLVAFIMRPRKTHENIILNPSACFLFIEAGKMEGKRIYLTKVKEEKNSELLFSLRRHCKQDESERKEDLYLVFFKVDKVRNLVGDQEV
ncbi:pyridoxamine 5'-phosphate oxidase family protein [Pelosinus sp. UFO1]|uniref:pyridoxamine 5'-phosphate oxidase family protein n=1 Tax=Pelosinus sp. UFO1 TaxID=484770 RepID=UPI0004D13468|nr:pyridoxamine 5'-phosphate oxidase family protein [Pelosinus sp. UFO1]AIF50525.1 pyridoxamine 5-phosphate oxidase-related FMN-binding protein [Pelosinus sp. UFO1]